MQENARDLATILTVEAGKPLVESLGEVAYAASFFEWFSEEAKRTNGETIPATAGNRRLLTVKQPVGVCGLITPWNFPAAMITRKVGPCFASGSSAVVKPAEDTPLTALAIAELGVRAGVPAGLLSVLPTPRSEAAGVGEALCKHPVVKKISFTGSTAVGVTLGEWCASGVKRTSFELGGNAPFIIFDDADLHTAVAALMASKFRNSGQTCVCANRVMVQSGIHDALVAALTEQVRAIHLGHGLNEGTTQGPLINAAGRSKVEQHVRDAVEKGGILVTGGESPGGNFFQPTILVGATRDMDCFREETFGPLCAIASFDTEEEVLSLANDCDVGLAGYFCSRDLGRVWRVAEALEVGMVGVNEGIISSEVAPFGGVKMSGIGREGGRDGIGEYLETKFIVMGVN
jgi:succinate-semialdehyde dehydrogenase/glutarate-semialdehyde dehydrogenase